MGVDILGVDILGVVVLNLDIVPQSTDTQSLARDTP